MKYKPTVDDILKELLPRMESVYFDVQGKFDEDESFYELEFKDRLNLPKEFEKQGIVLPTARDMVDTFVDHIDISNARVFVNKKGTSNISADEAEILRKFYLGLIHRTNVESDISPWRVGAKHYALHGLCVFKTIWDADRWPDKPIQGDDESDKDYADRIDAWRRETHLSIPIIVQAVHPSCIMGDPSYPIRQFVFEKHDRLVFNIKKRYPKWKNLNEKKDGDTITFLSYWDDTYRADFADEQPLLPGGVVKHRYGFLPYVFIDSGLGNQSQDAKMEKRYVGLLRYMTDLLISESRDYSIADIVLPKISWGGGFLMGENAERVGKITQEFGKWNKLPSGVTPKSWGELTQAPPGTLNDHLNRTSMYISSHAAPPSLRGMGETNVRSGADRRLVISEASTRFSYSAEAFKHGTSKVLTNCALLLKNVIPGDVRVWAKTPTDEFDVEIKKDKIKEPFTCYVEFAPISEEDEYRRHDDLERLVQSGITTRPWARTQMSNVDPIAMELEEEKEKLRIDPNIQALISQYAQGKIAEAISKRTLVETSQTPSQTQPDEQGMGQTRSLVPGIPNVPVPGSAQDLQGQLKGMRSPNPMSATQGQGGGQR